MKGQLLNLIYGTLFITIISLISGCTISNEGATDFRYYSPHPKKSVLLFSIFCYESILLA